jgi:hypothetical protein
VDAILVGIGMAIIAAGVGIWFGIGPALVVLGLLVTGIGVGLFLIARRSGPEGG